MKTGIELITIERLEQIEKHGRNINYDVKINSDFQMIRAVAMLIFTEKDEGFDLMEHELFVPNGWDKDIWNKMHSKSYKERLIIAGAFIAAELDRLQSINSNFNV